jgi:protein O-mannosyl-transferase
VSSVAIKPGKDLPSLKRRNWFHPHQWKIALVGLLLAVGTVAIYYPVNSHPFANYDDEDYVTNNLHVKYGLDGDTVRWAFTTYRSGNWHPLTWLSHALDCELFFLNPARHHDTSILLHAVNVFLLFWVLWRATEIAWRSFMVAALFAVHPINVQSVAWIAERKNLLSMFFFLLALGAYQWYARSPRLQRYVVVMVLFACGLMSKPQVITFPCVLLLCDYWPLRRMFAGRDDSSSDAVLTPTFPAKSFLWLLVEKLPLLAMCAASSVVTVKAQYAGGAMSGPMNSFSFSNRMGNAVLSYARYIGKALWPSRLALMYPHPRALNTWQLSAALFLLLVITGMVVARRRRRYLIVGWLWFLGTLVPMIGVVQVGSQAMADRYAYLPFVGLFIMICWGIADWVQRERLSLAWPIAASVGVLLALSITTHRQIDYWKDNLTLWAHSVQVTTNNYEAEDNLARTLMDRGEIAEALPHLRAAEAVVPTDIMTHLYLGFNQQQSGDLRGAIEQYKKVLSLTQDDIPRTAQLRDNALMNMGYAYRDLGDPGQASQCFEAAASQRRQYAK